MSQHFHAVVWIDHHEARVFHFNADEVERDVVHPDRPTRHIHHKANSIGSGHAAEDRDYLHAVVDSFADTGAVLITGPANAKTELVKHIHRHDRPSGAQHAVVRDREVRDVLTEIGKLGIQMFFADVNIEMNDMQVLRSKDLISRTGINNFFQV